jgi:hypothetical protein
MHGRARSLGLDQGDGGPLVVRGLNHDIHRGAARNLGLERLRTPYVVFWTARYAARSARAAPVRFELGGCRGRDPRG